MTKTAARRLSRARFPASVSSETPLGDRERRFVEEYLVDLHGANAAIRAGYQPRNARAQASRLLTKANIAAALERGQQARQARTKQTADDTVHAIACLAHSDIRKFYDARGQLKPIHALPDDLAACIASIEVVKRNFTSGDGKTEFVYKIKLWNKPQALELLGRHQYLFPKEAPAHDGPDVPAFTLPDNSRGPAVH
jgi:phage terminase small subunit